MTARTRTLGPVREGYFVDLSEPYAPRDPENYRFQNPAAGPVARNPPLVSAPGWEVKAEVIPPKLRKPDKRLSSVSPEWRAAFKAARTARKLTQYQVARLFGVSKQSVVLWETKAPNIERQRFEKLSAWVDASP